MLWKFAITTVLTVAPLALAAAEPTSATMTLARATMDHEAFKTPAGRDALTSAVRNYCGEVAHVYPQNSPEEDQWLDNEVRGGGDRVMRAAASPEWGRRQAKIFTDGCGQWIIEMGQAPDRSRNFVGLAYHFVRFSGDAEYFARKNGLDPGQHGFSATLRSATEALLIAALLAEPSRG